VQDSSPLYWAFLSYSSRDRATAAWLHRALERYRIPRRLVGRATPAGPAPSRFRPIFRDREELAASADLSARIEGALARSAFLIVICSPDSARSPWVEKEIIFFRAQCDGTRILTVIAESTPHSTHQSMFPPSLHYRAGSAAIDGRAEPLAADLRPSGDGRRRSILKLVAGMLGVSLDELVRRDAQRRNRQLVAITASSLLGTALAVALAVSAWHARNEAQKQRAHAEGQIEYMLTELRKKLEPSGRLDAMDGIGDEALKYYRAQDPATLDAQSLGLRARALRLMGEIKLRRGDLDGALQSFEQASATTQELVARSPNDDQVIFNHSQNVFWVGDIARQRGDMATAESAFRHYRALAEQLVTLNPDKTEWRLETVYSESALGVLLLREGRVAESSVSFAHSLDVAEDLAQRHPADVTLQLEVGQGRAWLADARLKQGHLAEARRYRDSEIQIYDSILGQDPSIRQAKYSLIVALETLGKLDMITDDASGAIKHFSDAATRAEALLSSERDNMNLTAIVAVVQAELGEALLTASQVDDARGAQQRAAALIGTALAHDKTVAQWQSYNDRVMLLDAAIIARRRSFAEALKLNEVVLDKLDLRDPPPVNTMTFWLLQRARLQSGDSLAAMGKVKEARAQWLAVTTTCSGDLAAYEPKLLQVLAAAELRLGRKTEADLVTGRLRELSR
jgi:tetratricopeptide (TPR) repeat protein